MDVWQSFQKKKTYLTGAECMASMVLELAHACSHLPACFMVAIPTQRLVSAAYMCSYEHVFCFVCVCVWLIVSLREHLCTLWYSKSPGGKIPNGIMGKDARRIPECLKSPLGSVHSSPPLHFTPHQAFTPPHLILVCLIYLPSFCPSVPSLRHSFALSLFILI